MSQGSPRRVGRQRPHSMAHTTAILGADASGRTGQIMFRDRDDETGTLALQTLAIGHEGALEDYPLLCRHTSAVPDSLHEYAKGVRHLVEFDPTTTQLVGNVH